MDVEKVGKAIAYLRKRAGYTQKDLADRIGISDKAVSKWERGQGLPEIGYLRKLSILLDTDSDSLLTGDVVHHDAGWQGVIVLKENEYGLGAGTLIYDKPLINYLLSYFVLVGIKDITILCSEQERQYLDSRFRDGREYGLNLSVTTGTLKDIKVKHDSIMMVYDRCILYGVDQTRFFQKAMINKDQFTMMVLPKKTGQDKSRITIDKDKKVVHPDSDELLKTQYDFSDIPILFFPSGLLKEMSKEKDIPGFISKYAARNEVYVSILDRGFVEIEVENWDNVQEASTFMKIVQDKCGMNVYCLEEVAWRRGMISLEQLKAFGEKYSGTEYGAYILSLYERVDSTNRLPNT